jgi:hypothetical protein
MTSYKAKLTAQLPPTPCTEEMRENLIALAQDQGRSLADLQRTAIALFLSGNSNKTVNNDNYIGNRESEQPNKIVDASEVIDRIEVLCGQGLLFMLSDEELLELEQLLQQSRDLRARLTEKLNLFEVPA